MDTKKVYPHSEDIARANGEIDTYRESLSQNMACSLAIEDALNKRYAANSYEYDTEAINGVIGKFGQERVLAVLAHTVRETDDGRYSRANRDWAESFPAPPRSQYASFIVNAHPAIVDGYIDQVRKAVREQETAMPGQTEKHEKQPCTNGAEFWRDLTQTSVSLDAALQTGGNYIGVMAARECSADEKRLCGELFAAMFDASVGKTDPVKLVYPYDFQKANDRMETSFYHDSRKRNAECVRAIDEAIHASCYQPNFYNLELAAMKVLHDFGFPRVNLVLAHNFQQRGHDGRFSNANKQWAQAFSAPEKAFGGAALNAHPILIDSFASYARKLYDAVDAERRILPGRPESGEAVHGYEIIRSITFDNQRGFAIGLNPEAVNNFVTWQFTTENGKRDFYWGAYANDLATTVDNYTARILVHMSGGDVREVPNPIAAVEMSTEQNYNMIDGLRNNIAVPRADLTDGQTHEEIRELAPETLPDEKPSVLDQIREAREAPKPPSKPKQARERTAPELDR